MRPPEPIQSIKPTWLTSAVCVSPSKAQSPIPGCIPITSQAPADRAAGHRGGGDGTGEGNRPVPDHPVDDDCGGQGRSERSAGEHQCAEQATLDADAAWQRNKNADHLACGVAEQQPAPRDGKPGQLERCGQQVIVVRARR